VSRAVVETSVVVKVLFPEEFSDEATNLFNDVNEKGWQMYAPPLLSAEVVNAARRRMRREGLPLSRALRALEDYLSLPVVLVDEPDVFRRALTMADRYGFSAYDAQYVALADMLNCDVWTADEGLLRAAGGRLPFIKWIGSYAGLSDT
jgi:predicted nucleic acid-binding protein